ncbi:MAG: DNA-3-methyladenine glycosylase 2 family protein [bacterium]|nr:DNA-3-methyladenine glycosylase 2 family protein [bacterium]
MQRFPIRERLPVTAPYRLDLTAQALQRLAANVVDVIGDDGVYRRALELDGACVVVRVAQSEPAALDIHASGGDPARVRAAVARMLGADADLSAWMRRAAKIPWLGRIATQLRGVHPPRYPTMWEACAHAIVFQQISIHAAAAIMRRLVERLGTRADADGIELIAFPQPRAILNASDADLEGVGLSANKRAHLRGTADALLAGAVPEEEIAALPTPLAVERLTGLRGIGPWSAAVVLLRGFGRLDIFPLKDSGVARTVRDLAGDVTVDLDAVLETLGPLRGMLYYHLLLGRLRNLSPGATDS